MRTFAALFSGLKSVSARRHAKPRPAPQSYHCSARRNRLHRLEPLEDRRLDLGDLLYTLDDPSVTPQADSQFGYSEAAEGRAKTSAVSNTRQASKAAVSLAPGELS